jgi:hypothetical protein
MVTDRGPAWKKKAVGSDNQGCHVELKDTMTKQCDMQGGVPGKHIGGKQGHVDSRQTQCQDGRQADCYFAVAEQ